jgi:hypothetical protein
MVLLRQYAKRTFKAAAIARRARRARRARWAKQDRKQARIAGALTAFVFAVLIAAAYWMLPECDPINRTTYCRD